MSCGIILCTRGRASVWPFKQRSIHMRRRSTFKSHWRSGILHHLVVVGGEGFGDVGCDIALDDQPMNTRLRLRCDSSNCFRSLQSERDSDIYMVRPVGLKKPRTHWERGVVLTTFQPYLLWALKHRLGFLLRLAWTLSGRWSEVLDWLCHR